MCGRDVSGNAKAARGALSQDSQPAGKLETASAFAPCPRGFKVVLAREERTSCVRSSERRVLLQPRCEHLKLEAHTSPTPNPLGFRFRAGIPAAPGAGERLRHSRTQVSWRAVRPPECALLFLGGNRRLIFALRRCRLCFGPPLPFAPRDQKDTWRTRLPLFFRPWRV